MSGMFEEVIWLNTGTTGISFGAAAMAAMWRCTGVYKGLPDYTCPLPMIGDCAACGLCETIKLVFGEHLFTQWEQEIDERMSMFKER